MSKRVYINCHLCGRFISKEEMGNGTIHVEEHTFPYPSFYRHLECIERAKEKKKNMWYNQSCNICETDFEDNDINYSTEVIDFETDIINALKKVWIKDNIHFWRALSNIGDYANEITRLCADDQRKNPFIMYGVNKNA